MKDCCIIKSTFDDAVASVDKSEDPIVKEVRPLLVRLRKAGATAAAVGATSNQNEEDEENDDTHVGVEAEAIPLILMT